MNIQTPRIITVACILVSALLLLGAAGTMSPAAAAAVLINNNATITNYAQVTLNITPPAGAIEMAFQNESNPLSAYEPAAATRQWTLSAGAGVKSVTVKFRDTVTKIAAGAVSATIIFDAVIDTSFNAASPSYPGTANFANTSALATPATTANAVAVYPASAGLNAGKTVTVGTYDNGNGNTDIKVLRYNTNGTLDIQYQFDHAGFADSGNAVAIQPADGKIVVAGTCSRSAGVTDVCLLRLNSDGTPDTAFGVNGVIDYLASGKDSGNAVALQADGKIVVAGTYNAPAPFAWVLRFNANGTRDTATFATQNGGNTGTIAFLGGRAQAVAIQADQKIIVAGTHENGATGTSAWVMRLNSNGTEDKLTFNTAGGSPGHNFFGSNGLHSANAVAVDPLSGKIVVVGTYNGSQAWVLQLTGNGLLDSTFNLVGSVALDGLLATHGNAVALQADGKIVIAGTNDLAAGTSSVLVARINNSGTLDTTLLDTTFNDGSYDYVFGTSATFAGKAVALQADGRIVVAGTGTASKFFAGSTSMLTLRLFDKTYPLTVTTIGSGTVAAFPGTLVNGLGNFVPDSVIQLTATPIGGASFTGWTGDCTGTGVCSVTMNAAKNVTATFTLPLNLSVSVSGSGVVASNQGGLNCFVGTGSICSVNLPLNTAVTLSVAAPWYTHLIWGGACSGTASTCLLTMNLAKTVTAAFIPNGNVKLNSTNLYSTLLDAYSGVAAGATTAVIEAQTFTFLENLQIGATGLTINLNGGLGTGFSANPGTNYTTIKGSLKVNAGRVNAKFIKIQ